MEFIHEHADRRQPEVDGGLRWGVEPICVVLTEHGVKIAPSTYYEHLHRTASRRQVRDDLVKVEITRVHTGNYGVYGARKVWIQLNRDRAGGMASMEPIGYLARCTVERLMREMGLEGARRGVVKKTTTADADHERPSDLVARQFAPVAPNRLWVMDMTYVWTWSGWVYVAFVTDAYARRILGWSCATTMTTQLVLDALEQAIWTRQRHGNTGPGELDAVVAHSDRGSQYTAIRYGERLADAGIAASVGSVGDSFDNALAETINGLYKTELIKPRKPWKGVDDVEIGTAEYVDWFNHHRLYEYCGDIPPAELEAAYYAQLSLTPIG